MMNPSIQIVEKPDWVSWEEIHEVLWKSHENNREKGIYMAFPALPGDKIKEKIEGNGKMLVALYDGKLVGTAAVTTKHVKVWCGKTDYAFFCFASVLPEYNGKGIFKALDIERERVVKKMGLDKIIGDTHENNQHRLEIARKADYKFVDYKFYKDHYNIVIVKWMNGCPYPQWYIKLRFYMSKFKQRTRYKMVPGNGRVKRFGI